MQDKNGATLNNGDEVIVRFTVYSADNEDKLILNTVNKIEGVPTPIIVPPSFAEKITAKAEDIL